MRMLPIRHPLLPKTRSVSLFRSGYELEIILMRALSATEDSQISSDRMSDQQSSRTFLNFIFRQHHPITRLFRFI